jgi:2-polyprenyl-3-methyl-5-hydroxy-6-metoxy-1,4-benzoquinol methylase
MLGNCIVKNKDISFIDDAFVEKIFKVLNIINEDVYGIRLMLKTQLIKSDKVFDNYKNIINTPNTNLQYGNGQSIRMQWVLKQLDNKHIDVLDYGCGEGYYVKGVLRKNLNWYGFDIDYAVIDKVAHNLEKWEIDAPTKDKAGAVLINSLRDVTPNISDIKEGEEFPINEEKSFSNSIPSLKDGKQYQVILSEVLEHQNTKDVAQHLLESIVKSEYVNRIIITTPNREFNKYYNLDNDELRNEDHKFEFNKQDLIEFCNNVRESIKDKVSLSDFEIVEFGDTIENNGSTLGVILTKN